MNDEWKHFEFERPKVGEVVLCYDSISNCTTLGRMCDEDILETMYMDDIEGDSQMEFWKPIDKPSKETLKMFEEI